MYSRFIADFTCNKSRAESIGWLNGQNPKGEEKKSLLMEYSLRGQLKFSRTKSPGGSWAGIILSYLSVHTCKPNILNRFSYCL